MIGITLHLKDLIYRKSIAGNRILRVLGDRLESLAEHANKPANISMYGGQEGYRVLVDSCCGKGYGDVKYAFVHEGHLILSVHYEHDVSLTSYMSPTFFGSVPATEFNDPQVAHFDSDRKEQWDRPHVQALHNFIIAEYHQVLYG